jgi:hypothetical protein
LDFGGILTINLKEKKGDSTMFDNDLVLYCCVPALVVMFMLFGFANRILDLFGKTLNRGTILLGVYMLFHKKWPNLPIPDKFQPKEKQPEDIDN